MTITIIERIEVRFDTRFLNAITRRTRTQIVKRLSELAAANSGVGVTDPGSRAMKMAGLTPPSIEGSRLVGRDTKIKPIFERTCVHCHSGDSPQANLLFTSRRHLLRGGDSGEPAFLPGDSKRSPMFAFISGADPDLAMPPVDERDTFPALSASEVALIGAWIDQGAAWPASVVLEPSAK